jgi:uncharacterized membrane protein YecN with MAPEG domain
MHIVPFYAAILALLFVALSVRTLRLRRRLRIDVGDAGNQAMLRAMRVHSNFAEYVPLSLLVFHFAELRGADPWLLHALGVCLVAGRSSHAYGVSQLEEDYRYRVLGMALTLTPLITAAAYVLYSYAAG